ncbi:DUF4192 domain-containing protein [Lentzea sp. NPDC059081]|uniref:DUF4192 domain-containing protein n=1 Tax=Lentzea sp. NPDC059081 TaxID=3346719 RepID=UPI0036A1376B
MVVVLGPRLVHHDTRGRADFAFARLPAIRVGIRPCGRRASKTRPIKANPELLPPGSSVPKGQKAMVHCSDISTLLASVPPLLGFIPENSLVCMICEEQKVIMTLRIDLPDPTQSEIFAQKIAHIVLGQGENVTAIVAVFGGGALTSAGTPPHADLIDALHRLLGDDHLAHGAALWAEACAEGARWCCYCGECDVSGTLPDPSATELAAESAAAGVVTHARRSELARYVATASEHDVARRAALLGDMSSTWACSSREALALVRDAVHAMARGDLEADDAFIARMAMALDDERVRDASLSFAAEEHATAAEHLFFMLTRECPAPYRAEPAVLAAFYSYLRGEGALASMALDAAVEAAPGHGLTKLLRFAIDSATPSAVLRHLVHRAGVEAVAMLAEDSDE